MCVNPSSQSQRRLRAAVIKEYEILRNFENSSNEERGEDTFDISKPFIFIYLHVSLICRFLDYKKMPVTRRISGIPVDCPYVPYSSQVGMMDRVSIKKKTNKTNFVNFSSDCRLSKLCKGHRAVCWKAPQEVVSFN